MIAPCRGEDARPLLEASAKEQGLASLTPDIFGQYFGYFSEEKEMIGVVCLRKVDAYHSYLKHLYVLPQHRRKGIARALMGKVKEECKTPLLFALVKKDNEGSKKALILEGFKEVGEFISPISAAELCLMVFIKK
ncbi:MAG: GNAT family N-acetyltransferase [Nanopusillaceae archaeon]